MFRHIGETLGHKFWVACYMLSFAFRLIWRALIHDASKFSRTEATAYARIPAQREGLAYGSAEYMENLRRLDVALEHHYRHNSHHPEHYAQGVRGMALLDVVEMLCDWQAAAKGNGDIYRSIEINSERFDLGEDLTQLLKRSVSDDSSGPGKMGLIDRGTALLLDTEPCQEQGSSIR